MSRGKRAPETGPRLVFAGVFRISRVNRIDRFNRNDDTGVAFDWRNVWPRLDPLAIPPRWH